MTNALTIPSAIAALLAVPLLLFSSSTQAGDAVIPPAEESFWPIRVFARPDSFTVRYDHFFRSHFEAIPVEELPVWLDVDLDSMETGERLLARRSVVKDNDAEILEKLAKLVSLGDEIGVTQFSPVPGFPVENFILGHEEGSVVLVPYDALEVKDPIKGLEIVPYLRDRGAFLTGQADNRTVLVFCRGSLQEVDIWYPRMATEVLHTHTIPGNINPTGYVEFFEGSDRDMIVSSFRFQDPIRRFLLYRDRTTGRGN